MAVALACIATYASASPAGDALWRGNAEVRHRGAPVVTFSAQFDGHHLIVTATTASNWHLYAMDNVQRAAEASGKEAPDCELPTRIDAVSGIEISGPWRQSEPEDLSDPAIFWHTWGFSGRAIFAAPAKNSAGGPIRIKINGQACNASSCSMIQDVLIELSAADTSAAESDSDIYEKLSALKPIAE